MRNKLLGAIVVAIAALPVVFAACKKNEEPPPVPTGDTPTTPGATPTDGTTPGTTPQGAGGTGAATPPGMRPPTTVILPSAWHIDGGTMPTAIAIPTQIAIPTAIAIPPGIVIPGLTPPPAQPPKK